ncbi:MAG: diguanylate cyclase, partial [Lachnospiraceae bacterium]|nr:diguanylate cyclase [Candidatus Merdinaster equi]
GQVLNSKGEVVAVDRRSSDRGESVNVTTKRKFSDTFHYQLIMKVVVPMMLLMLAVLVVLSFVQYGRIEKEAENQLKNCAATFQNMFEKMYGNDIKLCEDENGSGQQWVQIGDRMLGEEDSLYLDSLKKDTGIDFSYFYENVRVLTTIRDKYNARLSFTTISENISNDVIRGGQEKYYDNVSIDGTRYYAYYMPVMDKTGKLCGMIALAKPNSMIINQMFSGLWPIIGMLLLVMAIMIFLTFRYSKGVTKVLSNVEAFTKRVAGGNLSAKLSNDVLRRKDEFGSMGSSIISMQHSLRELIEKDALTTLPNRRYADKHLKSIQEKSANSGIPFSVAIADIDFFKKVNDTYGHECGDVVLKQTALILKKGMRSKGFASRWGGEEFLLVFDKGDEDEAAKTLNWIRLEIEAQTIEYEGMTVRRTMSFGVTTGSPDVDGDMLLKDADDCLYEAKQSGRNRVITSSQLAAMKEKSE